MFSRILILYNCQKSTWESILSTDLTSCSHDRLDRSTQLESTLSIDSTRRKIDRLDRFQGLFHGLLLFLIFRCLFMQNFITDRQRFNCAICRLCAAFVKCTKYNKRSQNVLNRYDIRRKRELSCYCAHWKAPYVALLCSFWEYIGCKSLKGLPLLSRLGI